MDEEVRVKLLAYLDEMGNKKRLLRRHFLEGCLRGVGMAVGFSILGAVVVILLQRLAAHNLPLIGGFLAELIEMVNEAR